jgi:transcriptional regulator with XRE-family HTH domain
MSAIKTDTTRQPHPVDIAVGINVRRRRKELGMSQETLAEAIDLTFQQVQKYEKGSNRISCSKLVEIAKALECSPSKLLPESELLDDGETHWLRDAMEIYRLQPELFDALLVLNLAQLEAVTKIAQVMNDQGFTKMTLHKMAGMRPEDMAAAE